jgi:hypothetical protein
MPVIPALGELRQEDHEFKPRLHRKKTAYLEARRCGSSHITPALQA